MQGDRDIDLRVIEIQAHLIESTSLQDDLLITAKGWLQPYHYDEIIEERTNNCQCGYPTCANIIKPPSNIEQYRIDYKSKQIFSVQQSKYYCSQTCLEASIVFRASLDTSNIKTRQIAKNYITEKARHENKNENDLERLFNVLQVNDQAINHSLSSTTNKDATNERENTFNRSSNIVDPWELVDETLNVPPPSYSNDNLSQSGKIRRQSIPSLTEDTIKSMFSKKPQSKSTLDESSPLFRNAPDRIRKQTLTENKIQRKPSTSAIVIRDKVIENKHATTKPIIDVGVSSETDRDRFNTVLVKDQRTTTSLKSDHPSFKEVFIQSNTNNIMSTLNHDVRDVHAVSKDHVPMAGSNRSIITDDIARPPSKHILDILQQQSQLKDSLEKRSDKESSDEESDQVSVPDLPKGNNDSSTWNEPKFAERPNDQKKYIPKRLRISSQDQSNISSETVPQESKKTVHFSVGDKEDFPEWFDE